MLVWTSGSSNASAGRRRRRASLAVAIGFATLIAAGPVEAQFFAPPDAIPGLSPGAVRRLMAERGFRVLTPPFRRGDVYVVDAVDDRDGRQIRIIVGAYAGRILQTFVIGRGRGPLPPDRPVAAEERLPFPGESTDDDGRGRRRRGPPDDGGGTDGPFGLFGRAETPGQRDPSVVPGAGPQDVPRPHRVARPRPVAPKSFARGNPPPLPGPKTIPAASDTKAADQARLAQPPAIVPPVAKQPLPAEAKRTPSPPPAPAVKPLPAAPPTVAKREAPPIQAAPAPSQADIGPRVRPVVRTPAPPPQQAQGGASPKSVASTPPAKPVPTKKQSGPLNDIPPAPLD